jgi:hypothetical protein
MKTYTIITSDRNFEIKGDWIQVTDGILLVMRQDKEVANLGQTIAAFRAWVTVLEKLE